MNDLFTLKEFIDITNENIAIGKKPNSYEEQYKTVLDFIEIIKVNIEKEDVSNRLRLYTELMEICEIIEGNDTRIRLLHDLNGLNGKKFKEHTGISLYRARLDLKKGNMTMNKIIKIKSYLSIFK